MDLHYTKIFISTNLAASRWRIGSIFPIFCSAAKNNNLRLGLYSVEIHNLNILAASYPLADAKFLFFQYGH